MTSFNIKNILLGIGIGMIITSIAGMIFFSGLDPLKNLSENDIVKLQERYGLERVQPLTGDNRQIPGPEN